GTDPNYLPDVRQDVSGSQNVGEIRGPNQPGQTFTATHDNLAQIQVLGATYGGQAQGRLIFHLKAGPTAPTDLVTQILDAARLPDNSFWSISFPPLRGIAGRQ